MAASQVIKNFDGLIFYSKGWKLGLVIKTISYCYCPLFLKCCGKCCTGTGRWIFKIYSGLSKGLKIIGRYFLRINASGKRVPSERFIMKSLTPYPREQSQ